jgi:hypothetical protein
MCLFFGKNGEQNERQIGEGPYEDASLGLTTKQTRRKQTSFQPKSQSVFIPYIFNRRVQLLIPYLPYYIRLIRHYYTRTYPVYICWIYEGESVNRSQIDIKHMIFEPGKKHSRHISHQHWYTCPIALPVRRNSQHRSLLNFVSAISAPGWALFETFECPRENCSTQFSTALHDKYFPP